MKIHLAGTTVCNPEENEIIQKLFQQGNKLHSFFHCSEEKGFEYKWYNMNAKNKVNIFLDSGAYSAFTQGVEIKIDEYIEFIKANIDHLEVYANLDVIGSPEGTWKNQIIMEKAGLHPLPCFHYGEDIKWLKRYLKRYDYIALGGMVPISTRDLSIWLDRLFSEYLTDSNGIPIVKIHGFGLTSLRLMIRYPWYSVDSTSWVMTGRMGAIYVPKRVAGKWEYGVDSMKVSVSSRSPNMKDAGQHISTFSPRYKQIILDYLEEKGYKLGSSSFRTVKEDYELQEDERWFGKAKNGKREVEKTEEEGISNNYKLRDELNIIYFLDLEKTFAEYPRQFKVKVKKGLF